MKGLIKNMVLLGCLLCIGGEAMAQHDRYYYMMRSDVVESGFYYEGYLPTDEVMLKDSIAVRVLNDEGDGVSVEVRLIGFDDTLRLRSDEEGRLRIAQKWVKTDHYDFFEVEASRLGFSDMKGWIHGYNFNIEGLANGRKMCLTELTIVLGQRWATERYSDVYMISKKRVGDKLMRKLNEDALDMRLSSLKWQGFERFDLVVGEWRKEVKRGE